MEILQQDSYELVLTNDTNIEETKVIGILMATFKYSIEMCFEMLRNIHAKNQATVFVGTYQQVLDKYSILNKYNIPVKIFEIE